MKYQITQKMLNATDIPYPEKSKLWHVWIDISTFHEGEETMKLELMAEYHGQKLEFYTEPLKQLQRDGYLILIKEGK